MKPYSFPYIPMEATGFENLDAEIDPKNFVPPAAKGGKAETLLADFDGQVNALLDGKIN